MRCYQSATEYLTGFGNCVLDNNYENCTLVLTSLPQENVFEIKTRGLSCLAAFEVANQEPGHFLFTNFEITKQLIYTIGTFIR